MAQGNPIPISGALVQVLRSRDDTNSLKVTTSFILIGLTHFDSQPICLQGMTLLDCGVVLYKHWYQSRVPVSFFSIVRLVLLL